VNSSSGSNNPGKTGLLNPEYKGRKVKVKAKFNIELAMKTQWGNRGIALLLL
jgi:hypothetical protein